MIDANGSAVALAAFSAASLSKYIVGAEPTFLFTALAGALVGVAVMPTKDVRPIIPNELSLFGIFKAVGSVLGVGAAVFGYAYVVAAVFTYIALKGEGIHPSDLPLCFIGGVFSRPLFPMIEKLVKGGVRKRIKGWLEGDEP